MNRIFLGLSGLTQVGVPTTGTPAAVGTALEDPLWIISSSLFLLKSRAPGPSTAKHRERIASQVQIIERVTDDVLQPRASTRHNEVRVLPPAGGLPTP